MRLIAITGITLLFIFASAFYDTCRIRQNKPIYHGVNIIVRAVFVAVTALLFWVDILTSIKIIVYQTALFWLTFDYMLNELRNKYNNEKWLHWWYVSNSEGRAWTDRVLSKAYGYTYRYLRLILLKLLPFIASLIFAL